MDSQFSQKELKLKENEVHEELRFLTTKLSSQARLVASASIAIIFAMLVSQVPVYQEALTGLRWIPMIIALLSVGTLCADFLQYLFGYIAMYGLMRTMEKEKTDNGILNRRSFAYRLRHFLFIFKLFLGAGTAVSTIVFLILVAARMVG